MSPAAVTFPPAERKLLLNTPRIGPSVVARLEGMGIDSLGQLRRLGVDSVVQAICEGAGNRAWANRRTALLQALRVADRAGSEPAQWQPLNPCVREVKVEPRSPWACTRPTRG